MSAASLKRVRSLGDLEVRARRRLPRAIFGYVRTGVEDGEAYRANRSSFSRWALRPKVLAGVQSPDLTVEIFGQRYSAPFGVCPMGGAALGRFRGDLELASGAAAENIPLLLSGASAVPLETVRQICSVSWFQAYLPAARDAAAALARRASEAGFTVLVVTVDVPVMSNRSHYERFGFSLPLRPTPRLVADAFIHPRWLVGTLLQTLLRDGAPHYENFGPVRGGSLIGGPPASRERASLSWDDIAALRANWSGKLVLKGLLHPADAERAKQEGVDGVIVSNHGGRQLDSAVTALDALPDMAAAAPGVEIMLDGGVLRGSDIIKALARGARFVFVGRPFYYAMAVAGRVGVRHAAQILKNEMTRDLAMAGLRNIAELGPDALRRRPEGSDQ